MNWYFEVLGKYAVFAGRAHRKEYWYFALFNFIITCLLALIEGGLDIFGANDQSILATLYSLAVLIPSISVSVRRFASAARLRSPDGSRRRKKPSIVSRRCCTS